MSADFDVEAPVKSPMSAFGKPKGSAGMKPPKILATPSKGLASGLKRIGGRSGVSRLGGDARRGRPMISHKY